MGPYILELSLSASVIGHDRLFAIFGQKSSKSFSSIESDDLSSMSELSSPPDAMGPSKILVHGRPPLRTLHGPLQLLIPLITTLSCHPSHVDRLFHFLSSLFFDDSKRAYLNLSFGCSCPPVYAGIPCSRDGYGSDCVLAIHFDAFRDHNPITSPPRHEFCSSKDDTEAPL